MIFSFKGLMDVKPYGVVLDDGVTNQKNLDDYIRQALGEGPKGLVHITLAIKPIEGAGAHINDEQS